ncbi:MAG: GNAT family N-acetyltransferase [Promethearchaeota archaeon]
MTDENLNIREYNEEDNRYVTGLMKTLCLTYNVEFNETRWENSLNERIKKSDTTRMLVVEKDERVIGMLVAEIRRGNGQERTGYISNLIVAPDSRNIGAGERLIKHATEFFAKNHVSAAKVNVRADSESALRLFAREGFNEYIIQLKKDI